MMGGEARFLPPIVKHFKGRNLASIRPEEIRAMAMKLYPSSPATRNRQGIIPARAVIRYAHGLGWCPPISVKLFEVPKSRKHAPVDRKWMDAFMAVADGRQLAHLSAIALFMHQTGTRVSEAVRVLGEHVDLSAGTVLLERTKTDEWVTKHLTAELVARIAALRPADGDPVFRYTDPKAVNRRAKAVAKMAGIDVRTTHSLGRHSFATNTLEMGAKPKDAMEAGNWKSARLFMETYVHTHEAGQKIAGLFDAQSGPIDTSVAQSLKPSRRKFGKTGGK